ncbi:MAG: 4-hydroxy-3-methylbut-2-enyl diphosphate reductase [Sulfuricurvum sp. RIFOXYD2_FULL_44_160]|uniref:4-hydroxy-3-methylbut-2-enyl diphosphate reductase n=1 Tax=Sulfuricurvum kujiense TaxID=148813 RepID=A0A2D3WQJ8_9BACT|nr:MULTISPECIES: 4-hydroxy-3-methylbut-2-enyl diphosphate reductase [Sulfuricurvum]OHD91234.1 MAG: 4-hydroxy-3-methylbut-2-enyl diphosphate reductase [Sulfuricurvum sp. RIFOXYD12_FULL_44_77]OHD92933.1 MAG: 4-hydroxy-3-methylbut-2-enyl diphosphate reductase [Sulfuricurvum sp. RIFOXYD2_FULL_44_160]DAB38983.1 MAG TPA: 4-hydroxy-3-methylbut-2-enyl diphosphate reductase [Sulfuricurvum kujiense]
MKIELAESYGFCFGVKRAIKIAEENRNSATYGPLIHNANEIDRLKNDFNVALSENLDSFKAGDTAVIRTHGIPKQELSTLNERHVNVIDATCPYVTKPQQICEEMSSQGYDIVIFGDEAHPEIKGVKSYAKDNVYVVNSPDEIDALRLREKVATVAQTTRKVEEYQQIVGKLMATHKEVRVFNTICNATFDNQDAVRKLAQQADVMIVIGGKNSSNTKQLHSIAKEYCPESYHIESQEDLQSEWFNGKNFCGISAGASTPDWIINQVIEKIRSITV